jgi:hypothetical protein
MSKHILSRKPYISVDRTLNHQKGAKNILRGPVRTINGVLGIRVPSGTIIGKDTLISLCEKITYIDGTSEIQGLTCIKL